MASENLDLVRSIYIGWDRADYSSAEWADAEIEFVIADGLSPGSWSGLAGMAQGFRDFLSAWEDYRVRLDECRELDGDRVLALVRLTARGKSSGIEVGEVHPGSANLFHIRGGKVTKLVLYFDRDRAFADLGLAREGRPPDS